MMNVKFEKQGTYRDYEYYVYRVPEMMGGYLLGYVKTDHFWDLDDLDDIECNGGISFHGKFREDDERHFIGDCIGWDYGHFWDYHPIYNENGTISSVLTVEMEARSVIDQILNK